MPSQPGGTGSFEKVIHQSPILDLSLPIEDDWVKDKTVLITGGASGLGEGFLRRWAAAGANIVIGDTSIERGRELVKIVAHETHNENLHFHYCDVTSWQSQVELFKATVAKSPHGGIDCVVANAGISDTEHSFEHPKDLDAADPPEPRLPVMDVNVTGVMYTTHLALFWLQKNPGSVIADPKNKANDLQRDRHLLLLSSMAGLFPIPSQAQYTASKHALVGLFRSLRGLTFQHGVRINMLCPYYIDTPIVSPLHRVLLAGGELGKVEDVVRAATRFVADPRVIGRAAIVGPKMDVRQAVDGRWEVADGPTDQQSEVVEIYAHDFTQVELSVRRIVGLLRRLEQAKGWFGYLNDLMAAVGSFFWLKKPKKQ